MRAEGLKNLILKHENLVAALLLAVGFIVRCAYIGTLPGGLNQDEASAGYDAWALLNYGIDRCGNTWPVLLESWGSGQNILYSLLAMPFIAVFGLSGLTLRIPAAVFGCVTLFGFWRLARRIRGAGFGLTALFTLTVCPWHIMISRWALESNLLPGMLLLGVYFTLRSRENEWALVGAGAFFGLSLYAYGTAYFFLPLFLCAAVFIMRRSLRPKSFFTALGVFIVIALPISVCQLVNMLDLDGFTVLGVTIPKLTRARQSMTSVFGGGGLTALGENIRALWSILTTGTDGFSYNSIRPWGLVYVFGLPLSIAGLFFSLCTRKDRPDERLMRWALYAALIASCLISGNINRLNMLWLPVVYFMAVGMHMVFCAAGVFSVTAVAAVLACFALFLGDYADVLGSSDNFFPGLGEAICYTEQLQPESVYITDQVNAPYIFALFYTGTDPNEFVQTVDYLNPDGAFRVVRSFDHFRFGPEEDAEGEYYILHFSEVYDLEIIAAFGNYCVCRGQS